MRVDIFNMFGMKSDMRERAIWIWFIRCKKNCYPNIFKYQKIIKWNVAVLAIPQDMQFLEEKENACDIFMVGPVATGAHNDS